MIELNKIYRGDCLDIMQGIDDKSVDLILCDLPYNTTPLKWDCMIPFEPLWNAYKRVIKPKGAIVLFAQQPFTTKLISSNLEMWKYNWIWVKENGTNFLNSHYQPIKTTEDICVFGLGSTSPTTKDVHMTYNPQMREGFEPYTRDRGTRNPNAVTRSSIKRCTTNNDGTRYPTNLLYFKRDKEKLHPTAKPVDLLRYLIRTYTNDNELVLDNCCGSGSTCVAAIREKRNFIGIELNDEYFNIASNRINSEMQQLTLF
jgi:site-specific DNA-methyltransferase (adenine-specific)